MTKKFILIILISLASFTNSYCQTDTSFSSFLSDFREAITARDKNKVAQVCRFPLNSYDFGGVISKEKKATLSNEVSKEDFIKYYSKIFTKDVIKHIQNEKPKKTNLYGEENTTYTLIFMRGKTSWAWLNFGFIDGKWMLFGTDNVSE
ncbi:MAG: hypothetical protein NTX03_00660 [Bacteroidetes bacterium]|nr:hypothetical protein [Bacteroidota bacterium]